MSWVDVGFHTDASAAAPTCLLCRVGPWTDLTPAGRVIRQRKGITV